MKKACKANLPAMIFLFALLILWQAGAMGLDAAYILPSPTQILAKLWELRDVLFTVHLPATMLVTAIGLGISLVLGLALAVVSAGAAYFGRSLLGMLFLWLIGGQMIFLCLSAFLVDGLLKANFNEDGSPAKKQ